MPDKSEVLGGDSATGRGEEPVFPCIPVTADSAANSPSMRLGVAPESRITVSNQIFPVLFANPAEALECRSVNEANQCAPSDRNQIYPLG